MYRIEYLELNALPKIKESVSQKAQYMLNVIIYVEDIVYYIL